MLKPIAENIKQNLSAERERWLLWLPVFFGLGIGTYFSLPFEPSLYSALIILLFLPPLFIWRRNFIPVLLFTIAAGFAVARINAEISGAPTINKLDHPVTLSGNIVEISASNGFPVLILEKLRIDEVDNNHIPQELRLSVRTKFKEEVRPGDRIITDAILNPPGRPTYPGGFDFARNSYFSGMGANGFAVKQIVKLKQGEEKSYLENLRYNISNRIRAAVPGDSGAMTDAIVTGDRSRISKQAYDDMRNSGLVHLIAISGINFALAAGIMFFGVRLLLSLFPRLGERYQSKKIAAITAIIGQTFYLLICGMPVSAVRSYIMVFLVLLAVIFDRAATPMRSVAFSALIILAFAPETMLGPGFQMSYAATIALISVYEIFARRNERKEEEMFTDSGKLPWHKRFVNKLWLYPLSVIASSLIAGLATAPYSAYHFNQFVNYGLAANLTAIPITSFIVMPFLVLGLALMPFGLESLGLVPAGMGNGWILDIAHHIASLPNSAMSVPQIATWGLVLATLGGLWFLIWQVRWRYYGIILVLIGIFVSPISVKKPDIMISENGKLFAINYRDKLYFSNGRQSFASKSWMKLFAQNEQLKLPKQDIYDLGEHKLVLNNGKCAFEVGEVCISKEDLMRKGAHNIYLNPDKITVETVEERRGDRLWTKSSIPEDDM